MPLVDMLLGLRVNWRASIPRSDLPVRHARLDDVLSKALIGPADLLGHGIGEDME
jgi:hypothetical protein